MKYCHNCGAQLSDPAKFCPHCGTPVPAASAPRDPAAAPIQDQPAAAAPSTPPVTPSNQPTAATPAAAHSEAPRPANTKKRWGIAVQFDAVAAGQKPQPSHFTYFYGFFQLLYHKSYRLFNRTYLPCFLAFCLDIGLMAYASTAPNETLFGISAVLFLLIAVWIVVVSIWLSRYYPQELYKQVGGDADRIPGSILPPVLGGVAILVLLILALAVGLAAGSSSDAAPVPETSLSEPAAPEEPIATPEPVASAAPTEPPAPTDTQGTASQTFSIDTPCLVPVNEPWKGAWATLDGSNIMVFENTMAAQDNAVANEDGSVTIYRADSRDGVVYSVFTFSADETTLTEQDADGNIVETYYRPAYDMAYTPLPTYYWGAYTLVENNTISDFNPYGDLNSFGPADNFIIDAFRFGNAPYQRLVDYGDGTWSAYLLLPPEGGEITFGFTEEGEDLYMELYDASGNVRGRYLRTAS